MTRKKLHEQAIHILDLIDEEQERLDRAINIANNFYSHVRLFRLDALQHDIDIYDRAIARLKKRYNKIMDELNK